MTAPAQLRYDPIEARRYLTTRRRDTETLAQLIKDAAGPQGLDADLQYARVVSAWGNWVVVPRDERADPVWCTDVSCAVAYILARWW